MQKPHWQWLVALGLALVIVLIVKLAAPSAPESTISPQPDSVQPTEMSQDTTDADQKATDSGMLADLPTVDQLQAMPTPAPDLLIVFAGTEPTLSQTSVSLGSVIQFSNQSTQPVVLAFSSGARMTVGAEGTAEYTVLKAGQEIIEIETETDLYQLALTVTQS